MKKVLLRTMTLISTMIVLAQPPADKTGNHAGGNNGHIYGKLVDGADKPIVHCSSMKAIEEQLPASKFIRIHKSYIVSFDGVTSIRKNNVFLNKFPGLTLLARIDPCFFDEI